MRQVTDLLHELVHLGLHGIFNILLSFLNLLLILLVELVQLNFFKHLEYLFDLGPIICDRLFDLSQAVRSGLCLLLNFLQLFLLLTGSLRDFLLMSFSVFAELFHIILRLGEHLYDFIINVSFE